MGCRHKFRIGKFAKAAGMRISKVIASGFHPSRSHGAGVSGLSEKALAQQRGMVGAALGIPPAASLSAGLLLEDLDVDPVTPATLPLVRSSLRVVSEGRCKLAALAEALGALQARDAASSGLRWTSSAGPVQATLLTLRRLGWRMEGIRRLWTDQGILLDLGAVCPREVLRQLRLAIRRWQQARAAAKFPYLASSDFDFLRAMYQGKWQTQVDMSTATRRGALLRLTTGGLWTRQRLCAIGRAWNGLYAHCGRAIDTP